MAPRSSPATATENRLDSLSFCAPSRIRTFLCPIGPITRTRFLEFVERLKDTAVIRLLDVTPDPRPERVMFSPQGFPGGMLVYNFTTVIDRHHSVLEDFELYRRTMAVFALADYKNLSDLTEVSSVISQLQSETPQAIIHKVIIFDCPLDQSSLPSTDFIAVPPKRNSKVTSMRTIMCDLSSSLLAELPLLAHAFQATDLIASPLARDDDYDLVTLHSVPANQTQPSPYSSNNSLPSTVSRDLKLSYPLSHHGERQRLKRKGRALKMIANMYLLAGRTHDALREYVEALNVLKSTNDHLWHAACLEGIAVSMAILAYLNVSFTIPSVVLPPVALQEKKDSKPEPPHMLELLPQITTTVLSLYNRSQNFPGESIPQITVGETILRTVNLLTSTQLAGGWNAAGRAAAVLSTPIPHVSLSSSALHDAKMLIFSWIIMAQALRLDGVDAIDASRLLTGIASAFGKLGFYRKRAFVLRQLVTELIPRIVDAQALTDKRTYRQQRGSDPRNGGSDKMEMQVSNAVESSSDSSMLALLNDICELYGIGVKELDMVSTFGWTDIKTAVLRMCIELCAVLPDHIGIVKYTNLLFRTAAGEIPIDDQISLVKSMRTAYTIARTVGLEGFEDEYWDPYLVREIAVVESSLWAVPTRTEFKSETDESANQGLFIYNPFALKNTEEEKRYRFVQDEPVEFRVILQNPYGFELDIKAISLVGSGVTFSSDILSVVVPPRKVYPISIYLTPTSSGQLKITGCAFQVYGCKETTLKITPRQVAISAPSRIKRFGGPARAISFVPITKEEDSTEIAVDVVSPLPILRVSRISLPQNSIMILEGERRKFTFVLGNVSENVSATSLEFKYMDSTIRSLSSALSQPSNRSELERYEMEVYLKEREALNIMTDLTDVEIPPNGELEVEVEIVGKHGLKSATIEIDYSHLDATVVEKNGEMYIRTLSFDLTVTVNSSIQVGGCDFVPFGFNMPILEGPQMIPQTTPALTEFLDSVGIRFDSVNEYCLMLLDLRNSWNTPIGIEVTTKLGDNASHVVKATIQPGDVSRLLVSVKRFGDLQSDREIPTLLRSKQLARQSGGTKLSNLKLLAEQAERIIFWYREELLKSLSGCWYEISTGRGSEDLHRGELELRALRITDQMVDILRVEDVMVDISIMAAEGVCKIGRQHWVIAQNAFATLQVTIKTETRKSDDRAHDINDSNNNDQSRSGILRVQPSLRNLSASVSLDVLRRFLFNGILQRPVAKIKPGSNRKLDFPFVVLERGDYELLASFEEIINNGHSPGKRYIARDKVVISVY
ncbi:TRAPP II complex [Lipomyces oligophaga]|uniref:TRAPP II complex n=1 Tax=Lipomyces oligophaga TaxID=45792 RepID=UPI0034CF159E